jgi:hypothetical protein
VGAQSEKIKAEDLFPKTSASIFLPVGLADYGGRETNNVLDVNVNFKLISEKKPRPKARSSTGRYDMKKTSITPRF